MIRRVGYFEGDLAYGGSLFYRWGGACKPGKWIAALCFASGSQQITADCVVDDFGNLVPVSATGMTGFGFVEHVGFVQ